MSRPPSSPRHLQDSPSGFLAGFVPGRQAARIRAIASSDLLPRERAQADALVLTAWLAGTQRARYAAFLRAGSDAELFAQRLADERRVALEEGVDAPADEAEAAAAAERAARPWGWRIGEGVLLLVALACAGVLVAEIVTGRADGVLPPSWPLLAGAAVLGLVLAAVAGAVGTWRRDQSLLGWAVERPGQLGRGLPLRRGVQGASVAGTVLLSLGPALLVAGAVIAICLASAVLLISLLSRGRQLIEMDVPWTLGGGVVAMLVAVLLVHVRGRLLERSLRRRRATEPVEIAELHVSEGLPSVED